MKKNTNNKFISIINIFFISVFLLISYSSTFAEEKAGKVLKSKGNTSAQIEGQEKRPLRIGKPIFVKDKVITEKDSSVTIIFTDKTRFELGPEATLLVNQYLYQNNPEQDGSSVEVLKGTFRFVSGLIAKEKPEAMEVNTSVATIGIRGTTVVGEVNETSATIILDQPEDSETKTAIEVSNSFGSVMIDEPGYGTEIPDQFSPPSPPRRMSLQTINNLTRSLQSIQRMNRPRPMR